MGKLEDLKSELETQNMHNPGADTKELEAEIAKLTKPVKEVKKPAELLALEKELKAQIKHGPGSVTCAALEDKIANFEPKKKAVKKPAPKKAKKPAKKKAKK